jgi:hypothetical protein
MTHKQTSATSWAWFLVFALLALAAERAQAADASMKIEALLVWVTNLQSTNKPVEADIHKKLAQLPLKWANYYEINRDRLTIPASKSVKTQLSDKCAVEVKNLGLSTVEVGLFGQGEQVVRRNQTLPKGDIVAFGGNAPGTNGWLVVLKRLE